MLAFLGDECTTPAHVLASCACYIQAVGVASHSDLASGRLHIFIGHTKALVKGQSGVIYHVNQYINQISPPVKQRDRSRTWLLVGARTSPALAAAREQGPPPDSAISGRRKSFTPKGGCLRWERRRWRRQGCWGDSITRTVSTLGACGSSPSYWGGPKRTFRRGVCCGLTHRIRPEDANADLSPPSCTDFSRSAGLWTAVAASWIVGGPGAGVEPGTGGGGSFSSSYAAAAAEVERSCADAVRSSSSPPVWKRKRRSRPQVMGRGTAAPVPPVKGGALPWARACITEAQSQTSPGPRTCNGHLQAFYVSILLLTKVPRA